MKLPPLLAALALPLLVAGCGLAPIYADGSHSAASRMLSAVEVSPIPDHTGFLVRERLLERIRPAGESPRYRLDVVLDDEIEGFGVRGDNSIVRERRTLRARYRLVEIASGKVLLDRTAFSDAGIDVVESEYAVVAAEKSAGSRLAQDIADQIVTQIALVGRGTS